MDLAHAMELGLDTRPLLHELREGRFAGRIREDFVSGVNGTPTFFINGARYEGGYDVRSILESLERKRTKLVRQRASAVRSKRRVE
jgi:hypothetical protein